MFLFYSKKEKKPAKKNSTEKKKGCHFVDGEENDIMVFFLFFLLSLPSEKFQKWWFEMNVGQGEIFCLVDHFWNMVKEKKRKKKKRRVGGNFNVWEIELAFEEREKCWNIVWERRLRSKKHIMGKERKWLCDCLLEVWGVRWLGDGVLLHSFVIRFWSAIFFVCEGCVCGETIKIKLKIADRYVAQKERIWKWWAHPRAFFPSVFLSCFTSYVSVCGGGS